MGIGGISLLLGGLISLVGAIGLLQDHSRRMLSIPVLVSAFAAISCAFCSRCSDRRYRWRVQDVRKDSVALAVLALCFLAMIVPLDRNPWSQYKIAVGLLYPMCAICMIYERGSWKPIMRVLYALVAPLLAGPLFVLAAVVYAGFTRPLTPPVSMFENKALAIMAVYPLILFSLRRSRLFVHQKLELEEPPG